MKPNDHDPEDEMFRQLFRAASAPVPDNGFTLDVLDRLPVRRRLSLPAAAWGIVGAAVGVSIASVAITLSPDPAQLTGQLEEVGHMLLPLLMNPAIGIATGLVAVSLGTLALVLRSHPGRHV